MYFPSKNLFLFTYSGLGYSHGMTDIFFPFLFSCLLQIITVSGTSRPDEQKAYDYCDSKLKLCTNPNDHTMCKYPVPGLSPRCTGSIRTPLSMFEKERILYHHNKCRSNVATGMEKKLPAASNMRQMTWDDELETLARRWAEQCETPNGTPHDKCRNTKRFQVSQNVGSRRMNGVYQTPLIVDEWCARGKDVEPSLVDNFASTEGHTSPMKDFTNMMLADTYTVGCARVFFEDDSQGLITERLVCNYGPAGNEPYKPLYKKGPPCSDCPEGTWCSRAHSGLCTSTEVKRAININIPIKAKNEQNKTVTVLVPTDAKDNCQCMDVYVSFGAVTRSPSYFFLLCPLVGRLFINYM